MKDGLQGYDSAAVSFRACRRTIKVCKLQDTRTEKFRDIRHKVDMIELLQHDCMSL